MKFCVLCLEHHSQQNSKALHCFAGFRHDVVLLFLPRDDCTLSVVLTHRKYTTSSSLSVAQPCFLGSVSASLFLHIDRVTQVRLFKSETVSARQQGRAIFRQTLRMYAGNLKPHPFGRQPAEYVLQRITLSLTSSPGLWLCAAFQLGMSMCAITTTCTFAPGWAWHQIRN